MKDDNSTTFPGKLVGTELRAEKARLEAERIIRKVTRPIPPGTQWNPAMIPAYSGDPSNWGP